MDAEDEKGMDGAPTPGMFDGPPSAGAGAGAGAGVGSVSPHLRPMAGDFGALPGGGGGLDDNFGAGAGAGGGRVLFEGELGKLPPTFVFRTFKKRWFLLREGGGAPGAAAARLEYYNSRADYLSGRAAIERGEKEKDKVKNPSKQLRARETFALLPKVSSFIWFNTHTHLLRRLFSFFSLRRSA